MSYLGGLPELFKYRKGKRSLDNVVGGIPNRHVRVAAPAGQEELARQVQSHPTEIYDPVAPEYPMAGPDYDPYVSHGRTAPPTPREMFGTPLDLRNDPEPAIPTYEQSVQAAQLLNEVRHDGLDFLGLPEPYDDELSPESIPEAGDPAQPKDVFDLFNQGPSQLPDGLIHEQMAQELEAPTEPVDPMEEMYQEMEQALESQIPDQTLEQILEDPFEQMHRVYDQQMMDPYMMPGMGQDPMMPGPG